MLKQNKISGFLLMLALVFLSSCSKHKRPAEISVDAFSLQFNNSVLERSFNIMNIGDEVLYVDATSNQDWLVIIGAEYSLLHAQTKLIRIQVYPELLNGYGQFTASIFLNSNGVNGRIEIPVVVEYFQSMDPVLYVDLDYLKFPKETTQDYITLYNDGAENLSFQLQTDVNWLQFSKGSGLISPNGDLRIYIDVNRSNLLAGTHSAKVNILSNGGDANLNIDVDVEVYSITFFNPIYTPITIEATGFDAIALEPNERFNYVFSQNPNTFHYTASTTGSTADLFPLGLELWWEEELNVSTLESPTFNLNVSSDYFFMSVKNTGNYNLEMWSVNYGNDFQIDDDFVIPNDGVEYGVAYYEAFDDTDIYARLSGTNDDVVWSQGVEFVFPWIENQNVLLENNFKKATFKRTKTKSSLTAHKKLNPLRKLGSKTKGSIDLYNRK